jgi:hypothetical protein
MRPTASHRGRGFVGNETCLSCRGVKRSYGSIAVRREYEQEHRYVVLKIPICLEEVDQDRDVT